jgi:4-hydroxy-3-methylbut-2-en-1-yl diphosphate synthase IspG/GcpE
MEKKEIQEWRDRLIKMFGIYHSDGQEYITCPLCGINLDELAKHMIEELDKAREEGRKEQAELDRSIYGMSFEEFDKKYKPVSKLNK